MLILSLSSYQFLSDFLCRKKEVTEKVRGQSCDYRDK